ncbi:unnamed protein product, partial [Closterium sp. NIES-54]
VSPTYAWEIGGHGAVAAHRGKFHGILNGIDPDIWDPMTDRFLPVPVAARVMSFELNQKFHGILNGIDPGIWDPMTDHFLPVSRCSLHVSPLNPLLARR